MSIWLVATLALCASVGSVELDSCTGVRSTYVDPVTNVRHGCQFICESIIRAYREYCMEYCPEYYQCKESRLRAVSRVQTTVRSTYPASDETLGGDQHLIAIVPIFVVIAFVFFLVGLVYICRKSVVCRKMIKYFDEIFGSGLSTNLSESRPHENNKQLRGVCNGTFRQHGVSVEGKSGGQRGDTFPRNESPESGLGTEPSQVGSFEYSIRASEGGHQLLQPNDRADPDLFRDGDHHPESMDRAGTLLVHTSSPVQTERYCPDEPGVHNVSHWAVPYSCSDGRPTHAERMPGNDSAVCNPIIIRRSDSQSTNIESEAFVPSSQCQMLSESIQHVEPDDAYTSLSESESAYLSIPYRDNLRSNHVRVDEPMLGRENGLHYPTMLTGSSYDILDVEQGHGERRAFLVSNQSLYHSQQPSTNLHMDQETRPKTQMTLEA